MRSRLVLLGLLASTLLVAACSSGGEGGRSVSILQKADGCTPASVDVKAGEKLQFVVTNEGAKVYEIEGIEGTELEEVLIPEGKTRKVGYTAPGESGVYKLKCYTPGGASTIIEVRVSGEAEDSDGDQPSASEAPEAEQSADAAVVVELEEFTVTPDRRSVEGGNIRFEAKNASERMVHELAVLRVRDDGSLENRGEIEDLNPGSSGSITLDLESGRYRLACLIVPGQANSTVDHYQEGMWTEFTVE